MNIVAIPAEPEYVHFEVECDGAHQPIGGMLNLDIAHIEFASAPVASAGKTHGNVQIGFVKSDVNTIIDSLVRAGLVEKVNHEAEDAEFTAI